MKKVGCLLTLSVLMVLGPLHANDRGKCLQTVPGVGGGYGDMYLDGGDHCTLHASDAINPHQDCPDWPFNIACFLLDCAEKDPPHPDTDPCIEQNNPYKVHCQCNSIYGCPQACYYPDQSPDKRRISCTCECPPPPC